MILKITLTHAIEGSIEIPEPDGWKGAEVGLERHPELRTLVPYLKSPFNAYGEFRTWCLMVEQNHGPDAIITAKVRYSDEERGFNFQELFPNSDIEIAVGSFTETVGHELGHGLEYGFVLKSFWARLQQRYETPVDLQSTEDLDGNPVDPAVAMVVPQTPQKLEVRHLDSLSVLESVYEDPTAGKYLQGVGDNVILDEAEDDFNIPFAINSAIPVWIFEAKYGGDYTFSIRRELSIWSTLNSDPQTFPVTLSNMLTPAPAGGDGVNDFIVDYYLSINGIVTDQFTRANFSSSADRDSTVYTYAGTKSLNAGDQVRIYGVFNQDIGVVRESIAFLTSLIIWAENNNTFSTIWHKLDATGSFTTDNVNLGNPAPSGEAKPTTTDYTGQTVFNETEAEGFLTHDLLDAAIKRICGVSLYSEPLGSPNTLARQYDYVGCAANFMHYKGLQLRQYLLSEKPFFASVSDIWKGINPVHCLAMGVDRIDGVDVVRVWKLSELYDETRVSATFDNVRDISRSYDQEEFFNQVRIGYEKGFLQDVASIDDSQTMRDYATILKKIGKKIEIISTMIGASLAFEITRRFTKMKSADHQFDNEIFIQAVRLNGEYGFVPELSEEFSDVTNLLNEETRYNKRITSARNFLRWLDYVSGCLQAYPNSVFKFTGGEGNYDMQATMAPNTCGDDFGGDPLSEKQDIPISQNYLFWPIAYTIKSKISFGQWLQIIGNMHAAIKVSQSDTGHMPFFTKNLTVTLSEAQMTLMAWPKRFFPLRIVQNNETEHENRTGRIFDDTFSPAFN